MEAQGLPSYPSQCFFDGDHLLLDHHHQLNPLLIAHCYLTGDITNIFSWRSRTESKGNENQSHQSDFLFQKSITPGQGRLLLRVRTTLPITDRARGDRHTHTFHHTPLPGKRTLRSCGCYHRGKFFKMTSNQERLCMLWEEDIRWGTLWWRRGRGLI